jgi:hypothetical protein
LVLAHRGGMQGFPGHVAELGPGDSLGVGLAALLSGARRYTALDAIVHADIAGNLRVFDELVELFRQRAPVPDHSAFPEIPIALESYEFPRAIIDDARLENALSDRRIDHLRDIVGGNTVDKTTFDYRAPWDDLTNDDFGSVDFLLSNAVMEHVADPRWAYEVTARWLTPEGYASHQIDFRSHALFKAWDGHWACPDWLWALFVGRRPYLLNREPFSRHREFATKAGLSECLLERDRRPAEARRLAKRFQAIGSEDRETCGAYYLLKRPPSLVSTQFADR